MVGAEMVAKVYPGASYAYLPLPEGHFAASKQLFQDVKQFIAVRLM